MKNRISLIVLMFLISLPCTLWAMDVASNGEPPLGEGEVHSPQHQIPASTAMSSQVSDSEIFQPRSIKDFGSGATSWTDWYFPGGVPVVGAFAGHPNTLSRGDRVLMRFNLSRLLIWPQKKVLRQTATLRFHVVRIAGKVTAREIEVVYLKYQPSHLTGIDLVNKNVLTVGTVWVDKKNSQEHEYSISVTKQVHESLLQGNSLCGFRFRDVKAEHLGNPDITPTGVEIAFGKNGPTLEIKETNQ